MSRRTAAVVLAVACGSAGAGAPAPLAAARQVVVTSVAGPGAAAEAVRRAGGTVVDSVPLAGGVVARLRPGAVLPSSVVVAEDRAVRVAGLSADAAGASTVRATLGMAASGAEGAGVTVAVVDTGVAAVPGLAAVEHVDVTGTGGGDGYGHGTFMAGLVAGGATGVAPGAKVLDVKVADATGETSLSMVLRGLEAVAKRRDVRVLNLSLSSGSPLPWQVDPLTRALGSLWRRGVVVVVPSGNDGPDARTITSPGLDPTLLTVGGLDENGTASRSDDTVPAWSSRGPAPQGVAKPDLAAPGAHLLSLRAPGSVVDEANASARVGETYFRGSGTSMATAVTSGAVAALLAARPSLTPDQVKGILTSTAYSAAGLASAADAGAGGLDMAAAYDGRARAARSGRAHGGDEEAFAEFARAWADGDYDAVARAWSLLTPSARAWAARAWAAAVWTRRANSWSDEEWRGHAWSARAWAAGPLDEWLGRAWAARAWADADWAGRAWSARAWAGSAWSGRAWAGNGADADWAGRAWAGRAWAGRAWAGRAWADDEWAGRAWADDEWAGRAWADDGWAGRAWADAEWAGRAWSGRAWSARAWTAHWGSA